MAKRAPDLAQTWLRTYVYTVQNGSKPVQAWPGLVKRPATTTVEQWWWPAARWPAGITSYTSGKSINAFLVTNMAEYAHPMLQYTDAM